VQQSDIRLLVVGLLLQQARPSCARCTTSTRRRLRWSTPPHCHARPGQ
jgi:hypothetical protein